MDITPQDTTQQPISDDQELAKALAGVLPEEPEPVITPAAVSADPAASAEIPPLEFEETPAPATTDNSAVAVPVSTSQKLDDIKKTAIDELRPLIDKVELPPEEKFNTYLMLIRSTDDATLIGPAHTVAQSITDESARAQALLDIIKEIDYLSQGQSTQQ
jgi:hypothetical protein